MSKARVFLRIVLLFVIFGPIAYAGYLNQDYFLQTTRLHLSLESPLAFSYDTPAFNNAFYWSACVFLGMLVAVLWSLPKQMRTKKILRISSLNPLLM